MKEVASISSLYKYAKNEKIEDLENFDNIYYSIMEGRYIFRLEDIVSLCELQIQDYPYMEPHQETKVMEMVFITISEHGMDVALPEFIKGLEKIIEVKEFLVGMYLRMMINSYNEEYIIQFSRNIINCSSAFKTRVRKLVIESIDLDSKRYKIKGNIILDNMDL